MQTTPLCLPGLKTGTTCAQFSAPDRSEPSVPFSESELNHSQAAFRGPRTPHSGQAGNPGPGILVNAWSLVLCKDEPLPRRGDLFLPQYLRSTTTGSGQEEKNVTFWDPPWRYHILAMRLVHMSRKLRRRAASGVQNRVRHEWRAALQMRRGHQPPRNAARAGSMAPPQGRRMQKRHWQT